MGTTRLLVGIRRAFAAVSDPAVLSTKQLLESLNADKEAPWAEYGANGLTPRGLQLLLKPYGIGSANHRFPDGTQAKGFARNQFLDTWARYCHEPEAGGRARPESGRAAARHRRLTRLHSHHSSPRRSAQGRVNTPQRVESTSPRHSYLS
ncbi:DUF3631 domain-containing protein [Streptomyces sp. NPDC087300]|uniref:DUF3631 domain-containing protein n=1 Tax=Streptomyces sp. NPDC087300 TaxID=3365780 RepID=UPI00383010B2